MAAKRDDNRKSRRAQTSVERTQYVKDRPKGGAPAGGAAPAGGGSRFEFKDRSGKVHRIGAGGGGQASGAPGAHGPAAPRPAAPRGGTGPSRGPRPDRPTRPDRADRPEPDDGNSLNKAAKFDYVGEPVVTSKNARGFDRAALAPTPVPARDARGGLGGGPSRGGHGSRGDSSGAGKGSRSRDDRGGRGGRGNRGSGLGGVPRGEVTWQKANVDKNAKGFAFLSFEKRGREDAFVNPRDAESLFHGDRVEVAVDSEGEVVDLRVLEHRFREIVGRFQPHPNGAEKGGWVIYERKRAREEVWVPQSDPRARADDWVKAKLQFQPSGPFKVTAEITDVYGAALPPRADIEMVAAEYNLTEKHTQAAEDEAKSFKIEVPGKDLEGRVDLRALPLITIDGETARDFDDAVYVERTKAGFTLWVGIADVSHYVAEGTALDKEAFARGTSVYFPERAFHMLPRALSENLCSLRPDGPRLAMVAKMEFDKQGERQSTELMEAVMHSKRRATYNEIEAEFQARGKDPSWEFAPHFALYKELRRMRNERGSIDFDLPEAEIKCEPSGEVISIKLRPRLDAHRLIEEFMIAANEAVTVWALERKWPFMYRVHDEPAEEKLRKFQDQAAQVGVIFSIEKSGTSPRAMADVIKQLEGHPAQSMLNTALLRSLKQAIYSADHGGHYGLASEAYTHFTSPIRRYPDLVVHRMLRHALRVEKGLLPKPSPDQLKKMQGKNEEAAEHCSYRERLASDAERESIKLKQVRAMIPHVGDEYVATVTGMMEAGMFVSVPDPYVEGLLSRDEMTDDFYQFNETKMVFQGSRSRKTYKVGDKLDVRLIRADIDTRTIDFGLLGAEISKPRPPGGLRPEVRGDRGGRGSRPGGGGGRPGGNGRGDRGPRPGARDERGGGGGRPGKKFGKGKKKVRGLVDGPSSAETTANDWGKPIVRPLAAPAFDRGGRGGKPKGKFSGGGSAGSGRPSGGGSGKKKRRGRR